MLGYLHAHMVYCWLQVLLFTATLTDELEEVAQQWQHRPVNLQVSASGALISRTVVQVSPFIML
jgi:superfamily II DNA/RNA helicase